MRGDTDPKETTLEPQATPSEIIISKKRGVSIGTIVDMQGNVQYHIVSTWWTKMIMTALFTLLVMCVLLGSLVIMNKWQIDDVQKDVNVEQGHEDERNDQNSNIVK